MRLLLGVVFVYASLHKILAPADFAKMVYGYALFPAFVINFIAIVLPYIELFAGLALIFGFLAYPAALIVLAMLIMFSVIIGINLARGHVFDCGCFSAGQAVFILNGSPWTALVRDLVMIAMAAFVILMHRPAGARRNGLSFEPEYNITIVAD